MTELWLRNRTAFRRCRWPYGMGDVVSPRAETYRVNIPPVIDQRREGHADLAHDLCPHMQRVVGILPRFERQFWPGEEFAGMEASWGSLRINLARHIPSRLVSSFEYPCSSAQMSSATAAISSTTGTAWPSLVRSTDFR